MKIKEFFEKFVGRYVWGNLLAMFLVVCLLFVSLIIGLSLYTHHGEGIEVPDLYGMNYDEAAALLSSKQMKVAVSDTGYNKRMNPDCILMQTPSAGLQVKEGRTIYVTINSTSSPTVRIPDIIDNTSYREAQARLVALGFTLQEPKVINGEADWVYGVMAGSRSLRTGDMVSIESPLTLVIGGGASDESMDDGSTETSDSIADEEDDFIEIVGEEPAGMGE